MSSPANPLKINPNDLMRVLVLDDDEIYRDSLRNLLEGQGLAVDVASTTVEAERYLASRSYRLFTTDIYHPKDNRSGDEFIIEMNPFMREFTEPSPTFLLPQLPDTRTELRMLETIWSDSWRATPEESNGS